MLFVLIKIDSSTILERLKMLLAFTIVVVSGSILYEFLENGHLRGLLSHDGHRDLIIRVARYRLLR